MSFLRNSRNYLWNVNNVLGKGATGAVYWGINKNTGEAVAVKSFNHVSHMRPYEVQEREFEVLKKVNHQSIVKLLAIEEEIESHHKVVIMELCTGGSLFNILDDPINFYGLEEKEFLSVLKHLAAGMKHLRDNNIIHRDLKPGNIMKFIGEDGVSTYKLTDFGAARVLEDDQPFMSLYGTEEYLHPDMYERAVLHKSAGKTFKANVDLWSIGVTLYHIATGSLPFKPYGGRKNKETMFKITTEKQSGIISGHQLTENGEIIWSRELPKTCLLSPALQILVVPLLAGLMECNALKMWSFEKFFNTVTNILSHKVVYVFYLNYMEDFVIYLNQNEGLSELKHYLEKTTSIHAKSALLLWNKQQVHDLSGVKSTLENPILLFNLDSTKFKESSLLSFNLPKFPDLRINSTHCDQDVQLSKHCSSIAYAYERMIEKCYLYHQLANSSPNSLIALIESNLRLLVEKQQACSHFLNSLKHQLNYSSDIDQYLTNILELLNFKNKSQINLESMNQARTLIKNLLKYWNLTLTPKMNLIHENIKKLSTDWNEDSKSSFDGVIETVRPRAKYLCQKMRESWQTLHKEKNSRMLPITEEQLHQPEKIKMDTNAKKIKSLLSDTCFVALYDISKKLEAWYTCAQMLIKEVESLFKKFSFFSSSCEELQQCLNRAQTDQFSLFEIVIKEQESMLLASEKSSNNISFSNGIQLKEINQLRQQRIKLFSVLQETQSLISEFEAFSTQNNSA